jgi:hypothetical protein
MADMATAPEPEAENPAPPILLRTPFPLAPSSPVEWLESLRSPGALDGPPLEVIQAARVKLVEIETVLRDLWYDCVEQSPVLAAQVNTAVRFAHHAADALSEETLL